MSIEIKGIVLGEGVPKICVPIVSETEEEVIRMAENIKGQEHDIVEWRADWYKDFNDTDKVIGVLKQLRNILTNSPIIFTIRTVNEGGLADISYEKYSRLLKEVAKSRLADIIDVEMYISDDTKELVDRLHDYNAIVIGSNHNFDSTETKECLLEKLRYISDNGADIPKLAVMPRTKADVINLLVATYDASEIIDKPLITMSMGKMGAISRVSGELFGSSVTFGCVGKASAPGQIEAGELKHILECL